MREFLEGHCLKIVGSRLLHLLDGARPGVADRLAGMTELADPLRAAERQAGSANTARQRGLYVDLLRLADGTLWLPSGISRDEACSGGPVARLGRPRSLRESLPCSRDACRGTVRFLGRPQDVIGDADAAADLLRGLISPLATPTASREPELPGTVRLTSTPL